MTGQEGESDFDVDAWRASFADITFPILDFLNPEEMKRAWPLTPADRRHVAKRVAAELDIAMEYRDEDQFYQDLSLVLSVPGGLDAVELGIESGGRKAKSRAIWQSIGREAFDELGSDEYHPDEYSMEMLVSAVLDRGLSSDLGRKAIWYPLTRWAPHAFGLTRASEAGIESILLSEPGSDWAQHLSQCFRQSVAHIFATREERYPHFVAPDKLSALGPVAPFIAGGALERRLEIAPDVVGIFTEPGEVGIDTSEDRLHEIAAHRIETLSRSLKGAQALDQVFSVGSSVLGARRALAEVCFEGFLGEDKEFTSLPPKNTMAQFILEQRPRAREAMADAMPALWYLAMTGDDGSIPDETWRVLFDLMAFGRAMLPEWGPWVAWRTSLNAEGFRGERGDEAIASLSRPDAAEKIRKRIEASVEEFGEAGGAREEDDFDDEPAGVAWERECAELKQVIETAGPSIETAEAVIAAGERLRELAERLEEEAAAIRENLERLGSRLENVREIAKGLTQEETAEIAAACQALGPVDRVTSDIELLLVSLEASLIGISGFDRDVAHALAAQREARDPKEGKRIAREVVERTGKLEAAIAESAILENLQRLAALMAAPADEKEEPESEGVPEVVPGSAREALESEDGNFGRVPAAGAVTPVGGDDEAASEEDETEGAEPRAEVAPAVEAKAEGLSQKTSRLDEAIGTPKRSEKIASGWDAKPAETAAEEVAIGLEDQAVEAWGTLMERGEPGLAWHLTGALDAIGRLPEELPRRDYLRALCFGRTVLVPGDPSALQMERGLAAAVQDPLDGNEAMLAMAALIRPALLAPETKALPLAISLSPKSAHFMHRLQQALNQYQKSGQLLTVQALRRPPAEKDRQRLAEAATTALKSYYEDAPRLRFSFHRADMVWKALFKRDGLFGRPIEAALQGDVETASQAIRDLLRDYNGDMGAIDTLIDRIDKEESRPGGKEEITAKARIRLRDMIQQALGRLSDWLDRSASQSGAQPADARIRPLRDEIEEGAKEAIAGARKLKENSEDPIERGAATAFIESMNDLLAAIDPEGKGLMVRDPHGLLHDGFLRMPGQRFAGARAPEPYVEDEVLSAILDYAAGPKPSWEEAFDARMRERSHIATARILTILELRGVEKPEIERRRRERDGDIEQARHDLVKRRRALREELDQALAQDAVRDSETLALLEAIEAIDPAKLPIDLANGGEPGGTGAAPIADFPAATQALDQVARGIEKSLFGVMARLSTRVDELAAEGRLLPEDENRIRTRLARKDYVSAADMIELVSEGEGGFTQREARPFRAFFPAACEAMAAATGLKLTKEILKACESGERAGAFDFSGLAEPEKRQDAAKSLHDWSHVKSPSRSDKAAAVAAVLTAIGFRGVQVKKVGEGDRKRAVFEVIAEPIVSQRICPIPHFGSECQGQWRVTVWSGDASPDEIVADLPKSSRVADLALVGSRMSLEARRKLAQATRRDRRSVLVLDESLYVWLLMQGDYRLPMFFDCALPFSWCDPYPATSGPVPIESFYGREDEIHEIMSPRGSSLVYGGRQLGKSALLEQVRALAHRPAEGELAFRFDFKTVGADGRPEQIWAELGAHLHKVSVFSTLHTSGKDFVQAVERWLAANPKRRLLLLLDEMDDFLVADGERGYENVVLMRTLMDSTQRRCKFVLAGLHDVQRASTTANTPLIHFGEPICVGPFYNSSDKKEARRMVTAPLAAAGYEFAEPWLPLRVLSQLHYYPSLVGVFCGQLAERQSRMAVAGGRAAQAGPPWLITAQDIEAAMQGEEARRAIKWRFDITLDLDSRYKLVALILALHAHADAERGAAQSPVDLQAIRSEAIGWWPGGFEGRASVEAFQVLLEEMQGLGVVIKAGSGWKFRSSRIAAMIGGKDEVDQALLEFSSKQPPELKWEPGLDRRRLSGTGFRRSPLNRIQEGEIGQDRGTRRAWIVFGPEAAGLVDSWEAVQSVSPGARMATLAEDAAKVDRKAFGWKLDQAVRDKMRLYWVGPQYAWDADWVSEVWHRKEVRNSGLRVIFAGGPDHALGWARRGFTGDTKHGIAAIQPVLGNALRYWLKDVGLEALDPIGLVGAIEAATGGYARYLESLGADLTQKGGPAEEVIAAWCQRMEPKIEAGIGIRPGVRYWLALFAEESVGLSGEDMVAIGQMANPSFAAPSGEEPLAPEAMIAWAETMGLAFRAGKDLWRPNPLLVRLLGRSG